MAAGENRWIKLGSEDTVILSSHPIPGNEGNVSRVIDGLTRLGVEVVHSGIAPVHASGHAKAEEIKTLIGVAEPEWFTPVHGEYRHLRQHGRLAEQMGVDPDHVLVCEDGDQLVLTDDGVQRMERAVPAGYLYVDGIVGDVGHGVLRDRRVLAEEGVVVVIVTVDVTGRSVIAGPEIITRGWVHAAGGRGPPRGVRRRRAGRRSTRCSATPRASSSTPSSAASARPPAGSSTSAPSAAR